jgi:hypothetical protein
MADQEREPTFVEGMWFDKPNEKAPEWVKGRISVKVQDFIKFAEAHEKANGYVDIDLKKSKSGKLYLELNTFVPKAKDDDGTVGIDLS